ncbi:MAG: helix-turn-helix domain-containing protein [Roseburia sp.]|nr:helix-turn-helix domain-containing protein [Roseburia sp.]
MDQIEQTIEKLKKTCGLDVVRVDIPKDIGADGVISDSERARTVFTVSLCGKRYAFAVNGCDDASRVTAAVAREYISSVCSRSASPDDALRMFLDGSGDIPVGVHVGKSDYFVFALFCEKSGTGVFDYLSVVASADDFVADMTSGVTAFCKKVDNNSDYRSAGEFALVLRENLAEEIKDVVKIGVGGVAHGVSELPLYFSYARSALVNGAEFDAQNDIYSHKEYALVKALSELSAVTMEKYVKTALDKNYRAVLDDAELMTAADAFIKHSLNISEASRSMYVHRNTLIYRLDKIEKMTGLDIRNFNDAMAFRVAFLISKML